MTGLSYADAPARRRLEAQTERGQVCGWIAQSSTTERLFAVRHDGSTWTATAERPNSRFDLPAKEWAEVSPQEIPSRAEYCGHYPDPTGTEPSFREHVALITQMDSVSPNEAKMRAWSEGPTGYAARMTAQNEN